MLKAFLLSAGLGTRLKPLTNEIPKCLLPINGQPLLHIWLELLNKHGVDEVLVNSHWLHEKLKAFLDSFQHSQLRSRISVKLFYEPQLLGSAGTLLVNKEWVADGHPFFILYGDNLTNVDLTKMYKFHCNHGLPFTLGVFRTAAPKECGIVEINDEGVVTSFIEKPKKPKSDLAAAGMYIADRRIFNFFSQEAASLSPLDLGYHVIPNLIGRMKAYFIEEFIVDIGTIESYEKAQSEWSK